MNIGIVGYGDIGKTVEENFGDTCLVGVYDKNYSAQDGHQFSSSVVEVAKGSDFVFITLPVSVDDCGNCDSTLIDKAMNDIIVEANVGESSPVAIIVTVVPPSVISKYLTIYKEDTFVVCSEFARDLDTMYDDKDWYFRLVGGSQVTAGKVCALYGDYALLNYDEFRTSSHLDACFVSLAIEASKVIFGEFLYPMSKCRGEVAPSCARYTEESVFAEFVKKGIGQQYHHGSRCSAKDDIDKVNMLRFDGFVVDHEFDVLEQACSKRQIRSEGEG